MCKKHVSECKVKLYEFLSQWRTDQVVSKRWQEVVAQAGDGKNVTQCIMLNTVRLIPHAATHRCAAVLLWKHMINEHRKLTLLWSV